MRLPEEELFSPVMFNDFDESRESDLKSAQLKVSQEESASTSIEEKEVIMK
jgi:hypothetical protein